MRRAEHEQLIGRTIAGKFVVESLIGSGAMGAVYRARQVALEKTVAIKVLHGEHAGEAAFVARFQREAKAASRMNHPNSMQVIDFGAEPDGLLYIAMEYLDGRSLHRVLVEDRPLPPARIADILMQTLAALAVAHDMGVVHRDLKPENIMVLRGTDDDGRPKDLVKVCDFGIAKITDSRAYRGSGERESVAPVTTAGFLVGTPEYMSPEQGNGSKLDARSDLYSVGVILFEMLTGQVPFEAENAIGTVLKHITEAPRRPSDLQPGVDRQLQAICLRALRKPREERYPGAREMRAELRAVLEDRGLAIASQGAGDPGARALAGSPASASAETIQLAAPAPLVSEDAHPKPTLVGTTSTVPRPPGRGRIVAVGAMLVLAGFAMTLLLLRPSHRSGALAPPVQSAMPASAPSAPPLAELAPLDLAVEPQPFSPALGIAPTHSKMGPPSKGTTATATPTATAPATAIATPTATAPANPPSLPPPLVDPTFDPDRGYVEVGLISAQGVRERAVRGALHGVALSSCYKSALKAQGARASGIATLNLAFDETGLARSAILTGGDFLPGLTRCVQGASTGIRIAQTQVESGGGTAEVVLAFKVP
jgi:eukaryotic-like serine/threonine-protein kinase